MKAAGGRRAGDHEARLGADFEALLVRSVEHRPQHCGRHAGEADAFLRDQPEDPLAVDGAQDHVGPAHARQRVDPAPAVAMEHRQRPELDVVVVDAEVGDHVVGVQVAVAMRHHDALGSVGRARGVVDRDELVLADLGSGRGLGTRGFEKRVPGLPARRRLARVHGHDPMLHLRQGVADLVEHARVLAVDQHRRDPGVIQDVLVIRGDEPVVQRDEHQADLRRRVEALEEEMRVRAQDADAIAAGQAEVEQGVREPMDALVELAVAVAAPAVDDCGLLRVETHGASQEVGDEQRDFHRRGSSECRSGGCRSGDCRPGRCRSGRGGSATDREVYPDCSIEVRPSAVGRRAGGVSSGRRPACYGPAPGRGRGCPHGRAGRAGPGVASVGGPESVELHGSRARHRRP